MVSFASPDSLNGAPDGTPVGIPDGTPVGIPDGTPVGIPVGISDGIERLDNAESSGLILIAAPFAATVAIANCNNVENCMFYSIKFYMYLY